ncbi:hypothetical protein [Achromobacter marplatensis]|uniref:hypothetical protein n=1 Tax=Achromobacter marplatensis TaxID=470868 RepID=UPI0039F6E27E
MLNPTLSALDRGDVELCEWTVELFSKALRVDAALLLAAQTLLAQTRATDVPHSEICGSHPGLRSPFSG